MAEGLVTFFTQKLTDMLQQEANLLRGVKIQVRLLHDELECIRVFLEDADQTSLESSTVKPWLVHLRDVVYDAEDVLDAYIQQQQQQLQRRRSDRILDRVQRYIGCASRLMTLRDVAKQIEEIKERLQKISNNRKEYDIGRITRGEQIGSSSQERRKERRVPIAEEADVVGFKDDETQIAKRLIEGEERLSVVSIVGMGGQGKTTLAKKVYNRSDVKSHFHCHAWISVSQDYREREILLSIVKSVMVLSEDDEKKLNEENLSGKLLKFLKEKRYLLVVDDIWRTEAWDSLSSALPNMSNGSRILLTTRNREVALDADPQSNPYNLRFLTEAESWELFCKKIFFGNVPTEFPSNLEDLGTELLAKCDRLPLAIVVLGGILSKKEKVPKEWDKILKSFVWQLSQGPNQISSILALSYHDLPYYLKSCFLYLGAFPEDHEIPSEELIRLWIAEGFVQRRGEEEMEDVAEDWLEELIDRSMVQVVERDASGAITRCRVHDLLRDLSISKADESRFLNVYRNMESSSSQTTARRLAIIHRSLGEYLSLYHIGLQLRSLLCFSKEVMAERELKKLFCGFKLIRVMNLENIRISSLPNEIGYLIHLRYLFVRGSDLRRLPNTVTCLYNLQTLDVSSTSIHFLPNDAWKMQKLRHLLLPGWSNVDHVRLHRLSNLQTLRGVPAGSWLKDCVGKLTSLTDLGIRGEDFVAYGTVLPDFIVKLVSLRHLRLEASREIPPLPSFSNHHHLYHIHLGGRLLKPLELHEFPPNLCELNLNMSQLEQDPLEVLGKLTNLRILRLHTKSFIGKEMVASVGGFPQLETFEIGLLEELVEWKIEEGAMLNLKNLIIYNCKNLKMLPQGLQHITTLRELKLISMTEDFRGRVKEREGEDWHKIQHIPSLIIRN